MQMAEEANLKCEVSKLLAGVYNLMRQGEYEVAIRRLLVKGHFKLRTKYSSIGHDAWYAVGDCYSKLGKYKRALVSFKNAYRARPADRDTLFAIANCYSEMGDPEFAVIYFGYLCALNESDFEARFNLGNAYMDVGEFGLALNNFDLIKSKDKRLLKLTKKNAAKAQKFLSEKLGER